MTTPDRESGVGRAFVALADTLVDDYDVIELLEQLAGHAVSLLAADAAGILLGDARRELQVAASSNEDAATIELLQLQADQGPCLDCFSTAAPVSVPDLLGSEPVRRRWPQFVASAERAGSYRSVHALPLRLRGEAVGAMNLFHREPGPLPPADLALGQALADVAAIGILSERAVRRRGAVTAQLQGALDSRAAIEQAKGVIAQSLGVGMDVAFDLLRRYCRDHNLRVGTVARQVGDGRFAVATLAGSAARPRPSPRPHR